MASTAETVNADAARLIDTRATEFIVDIGGANGTLVHELLSHNAELRGAVFDLPHVLRSAQEGAAKRGLTDRFSTIGGDATRRY